MQIHQVEFPLVLPSNPWKRHMKILLGRFVLGLRPELASAIEKGEVPEKLDQIHKFALAALVDRHQRTGTLSELAHLHDWLWQGEQALSFHEQGEHRFETWWLEHHSAIIPPLREELSLGNYSTICEIGCGSGLILENLSHRFPLLEQFVGLDLSPAQTEKNRARFAEESRLRFESGDAAEWIPSCAEPNWAYFTNAGVLEYFPRQKLEQLLARITFRLRPACFALIEPIAADFDLETEQESRPYGTEQSWSHNYPQLFQTTGFEVVFQEEQVFDGIRWLLMIARV